MCFETPTWAIEDLSGSLKHRNICVCLKKKKITFVCLFFLICGTSVNCFLK